MARAAPLGDVGQPPGRTPDLGRLLADTIVHKYDSRDRTTFAEGIQKR